MVLYLGKLCEVAPTESLFAQPTHPYTQLLLESVPTVHDALRDLEESVGTVQELPSPLNPPSGCRFRTRCPLATELCADVVPPMQELSPGHFVACHHADIAAEKYAAKSTTA